MTPAERPILFSAPMVRAILDGRKTETRRVVRDLAPRPDLPEPYGQYQLRELDGGKLHVHDGRGGGFWSASPYGVPGDLLYVRERGWQVRGRGHTNVNGDFEPGPWQPQWSFEAEAPVEEPRFGYWARRPAIHMPKAAARIWLRVEEVRVERVQDIDEAGSIAEGVSDDEPPPGVLDHATCRQRFHALWDSINAKRGYAWDANPFVWVVCFSVASTTGRPT